MAPGGLRLLAAAETGGALTRRVVRGRPRPPTLPRMLKLGLIAVGGALGALLRYGLAGVVQERSDSLFPVGTLAVNVAGCFAIGLLAAFFAGPYLIREEVRAFALVGVLGSFTTFSTYGLETVGLASRQRHIPAQLSGGQQQRVAIARALAGEPKVLLADEPTGNLDTTMAHQVMELLEQIHASGTTIVMVTHDPDLAMRAERNIHLIDGRVSAEETTEAQEETAHIARLNGGAALAAQI